MAVKLNVADIEFILRQVKISEAHAAGTPLTEIWVDAQGNVVPAGTPDAVPAISDPLVPFGLRTVDGTFNNLVAGQETWGAADETMPRMLTANFLNDADGDEMPLGAPSGPLVTNNDYGFIGTPSGTNGGHTGNVADADPRIISNLVNDQSIANPAAVEAWFANEAAVAAFHARYGDDAIPVRPGESPMIDLAVANASFEGQSLATGQPGVIADPLGNYTTSAPAGWTIAGTGGLFAPTDAVSATAGHPGPNVAWLTNGAALTQDSVNLNSGVSYQLGLSVGDRTDQVWTGGTASLIAVGPGGVTTVLNTITLPEPADGQWADVMLDTGVIPLAFAGQTLRIEVQQTGGAQVLVDNVTLKSSDPNKIEIDNIDLATIPNIAPDDGISAPFNAWMTFFGQFFDHGLDLISKGDNGTIFVPLQADDPLVLGADGIAGTTDDLRSDLQFMAVTRSTPLNGPGADGILGTADDTTHEGRNTTTPFVDQNQTYTSHASHQVFLREYAFDDAGRPVATGKLLDGAGGGLPTWAEIKTQARTYLGIELTDGDALNIPLLRTDQYGEFVRGDNGLPQIVTGLGADGIPNTADDTVVEGNLASPVNTFTVDAVRIGHAFLDDIAHAANPFDSRMNEMKIADDDSAVGLSDSVSTTGTYDNELLDRHFITGDGRGNENIGLTAVHHVFHSEHNRQVEANKKTVLDSGNIDLINEFLLTDITEIPADTSGLNWDGERLFQTARFATEMQYQHLVFEEFGRKIHPNIDPFVFNAVTDINPAIFAEFANVVYRFGHSMLTDSMPRVMIDDAGNVTTDNMGLIKAFLNPIAFDNDGAMTANEASAAVILGMTTERGSQIDEFVVSSLRSNLLGLPLDLAAINIARGRDTGMPTFNDARAELYQQTNSPWLKPYANWVELASNLKNPMTIVNLIAAYGTHASIEAAMTLADKRDAAFDLVFGGGAISNVERFDFLLGRNSWRAESSGLNSIDLWVGGLAERIMPFGGMLGSTFTAVFEAQMEALQDGDRFYYLSRTQGQNFLNELEQNSLSKMLLANTSLSDPGPDGIRGTADDIVTHHIGVDSFTLYDFVLEVNQANQLVPDPVGNDPVLEGLGMGKVVRDDPTTAAVETNYIRFTGGEHVAVGGTSGSDTIITSDGDDGIWGDDGDDYIESGFGVDLVNGGGGNDIILDSGDEGDFLKGEDGDDVIASANGLDILMGGRGKDAIFLGVDAAEIFGGEGDDFILGGDGADFLLGNEGDDWMEAGGGFDTTAGDNSELFFNSLIIGHDVMFAGSDEHDFDAESGDDIMVQGASVMRNEGMFGFDWSIFKGVTEDAYADMRIKIFTTEQADILRNRFDKVEALSGWDFDDTLIGDDRTADGDAGGLNLTGANEGVFFNDGLNQEGIDRIDGLSALVSIADGAEFWEQGNILLGGGGSDMITGNGGDDILDGDRWLNVRIRITGDPTDGNTAGNEIATVDSLKHVFTASDAADPSWVGKSLFELLVSRAIVPGQMNIVREILTGGVAGDTDIAIFNDDRGQYTITTLESGAIQVAHTGFGTNADVLIDDGVDTLHNIEVLRFRDGDVVPAQQAATGQPVISDTTPTEEQTLTVDLSSIADGNGIVGAIAVQWQSFDGTNWNDIVGATDLTYTPSDAPPDADGPQVGQSLRVAATFIDGLGGPEIRLSEATQILGDFWVADAANLNFRGGIGDDHAIGNAQRNDLRGGDGSDILEGGAGVDRLLGGAGNDLLVVNFATGAGGSDILNGQGGVDTVEITGSTVEETFGIYTRAAALAAGLVVRGATTEIVITRSVGAVTEVIANLDNIEEIIVNMTDATPLANGVVGGDTIQVFGDFSTTSLNLNTIHITGSSADDVVDISNLSSAHRIVFRGAGGNDTIVGAVRPQDVIDLPGTGNPVMTEGLNGMVTLSRGGASVTFNAAQGMPSVGDLVDGDDADTDEPSTDEDKDNDDVGTDTSGDGQDDEDDADDGDTPADDDNDDEDDTTDDDGDTDGDGSPDGDHDAEDETTAPPPLAAAAGIIGTAAGEALFGTAAADSILSLGGRDMVFAGAGDDVVLAGAGRDMVFGDAGDDRIFGEGGDDFIDGGAGSDFVVGGDGDDTFVATASDGDDVYYGDDVAGGTGTDTLDMSRITADITADLGSGAGRPGHASSAQSGTDVLWSIENFLAGAGDDVITAGRGVNTMDGGVGSDTYRFLSAEDADGDTIAGFEPGDRIDLSQIDANGSAAGKGNFTLVSDDFTGSGQLLVTHETSDDGEVTVIHGNVDGDNAPDFSITIRGRHNLVDDDFQL
jgi:Ca2+-binding RTX toxin-like protein